MTTIPSLSPEAVLWPGPDRQAVRRVGLWVLIGVVSMLFLLFGAAYVMRMAVSDWRPLPVVPWQLWCSTELLLAASIAWQLASRAASRGKPAQARLAGALACGASVLFLGAQLWAWHAMSGLGLTVAANPANSFFYLITGLHGMHVLGGLFAAVLAGRPLLRGGGALRTSGAIELCARYWHFLLLLWLAMFAMLFLVTPAVVQAICGSP
ncbi:cytochrome c oxidase subunit 3 [Rugamonas apoptosis]|uniref:Cytochrome c oxidase subunit 3 n=1 Tax=Rugamonas apoptosis TaxID=2758570 RepID=A0A7W2F9N1_9BURK|nr:cytochrome c oxidase subunit 3 [Rugamonas apoptosis]MBA5687703.1 cytochrome c oxidase subunit 3 [Rugamonas apoptosis]